MSVFTNETWLSHNFLMGSGVVAHVVYTILPSSKVKQP